MFGYSDYFDDKKKTLGYADGEEELLDHLHLLDMLIEHFLDAKTKRSEGLVFSRGMRMTEAETESYYFKAPSERVSMGYDADFAADVKKALSHIKAREDATADDVMPPINGIVRAFSLSDEMRLSLIAALAVQLDLKYPRLFGYLSNEPSLQNPTVGAVLSLIGTYDEVAGESYIRECTDSDNAFLTFCIREQDDGKKEPFLRRELVIHEELLSYIYGHKDPNGEGTPVRLPDSYKEFLMLLKKTDERGGRYYIECEDPEDALLLLRTGVDTGQCVIDLDRYESAADPGLSGEMIRTALSGSRAVIRCSDIKRFTDIKKKASFFRTVYICGEPQMPDALLHDDTGVMTAPLTLSLPDADGRLYIWEKLLADEGLSVGEDVSIGAISDTYAFSYTRIKNIVSQAKLLTETSGDETIGRAELLSVVFRYNAANFAGLATQVHTTYVWEDMEIADLQKKRLMTACDRYRLRDRIDERYGVAKRNAYGNGVSVLMYGAPGTGKTMAAQVMANELGLPLYRVDVSQIFSKYIGETEKNLAVIFEEAKKADVILFFDEADALFSKRTEVGDSSDRYANAETAYLLQKIEAHNGMTILATNLYHNFDSAFLRRITYAVHIDSPDEATRLRLWKHTLPEGCTFASDVDFDFLAEGFEISGSNIKAILQSAAYMAGVRVFDDPKGDTGFSITMADVVKALRYELEKLGRIIDSTDFGNYGVYL